jgi:hypothetical protein
MRIKKLLLLLGLALLAGGGALSESAHARGGGGGGGGGGRGGGGRGGAGRGKGKKGSDGNPMDRAQTIEAGESEMHTSDRDKRFTSGRKSTFDDIQKTKRNEVLDRHRRMGEDSRRQQDSRNEVSR